MGININVFFGENSGIKDNVYGNDVSFYMLAYPTYQLIQQELLLTATSIFVMVRCVILA
jgi:uncharacterized membrane protein (UPF0182 family)